MTAADDEMYSMRKKRFQALIEQKKCLTPTILWVRLKLKNSEVINFQAGQHIILRIPVNHVLMKRPLSIASSPGDKKHVEIIARLIEGGLASTFLANAPVNTELLIEGPSGKFILQASERSIYFITSGSGIAPFRAMLYQLLEVERTSKPVTLLFMVSTGEEKFLQQELRRLSSKHENFHYALMILDERASKTAADTLHALMKREGVDPESDFYLCGGVNFVRDVSKILAGNGVARQRIHSEKFT